MAGVICSCGGYDGEHSATCSRVSPGSRELHLSITPAFLLTHKASQALGWKYRELINDNDYTIACECEGESQLRMTTYKFRCIGDVNERRCLNSRINLVLQAGRCPRCGLVHWACGDLADLVRLSEAPVDVRWLTANKAEVR